MLAFIIEFPFTFNINFLFPPLTQYLGKVKVSCCSGDIRIGSPAAILLKTGICSNSSSEYFSSNSPKTFSSKPVFSIEKSKFLLCFKSKNLYFSFILNSSLITCLLFFSTTSTLKLYIFLLLPNTFLA